jgi:hypothetical protein
MQRAGLEWVHRLAHEPRRLSRRYLVQGLPFAARLLAHGAAARFTGERPHVPPLPAAIEAAQDAVAEVAEAIEPHSAATADSQVA